MNLAWKDIRHQWPRFLATALGLGLLFTVVLAMGGIYRGLVEEATLLVDAMRADLWVVQRDTRGPFAERSVVPLALEDRVRVVAGVASAEAFATTTVQREREGRPLRLTLVGLSWPTARGEALPLVEGRALEAPRREMVADVSSGLALGERVPLGDETYEVVGRTRGMLGTSGDGAAFVTNADLRRIEGYLPPEAVRQDRLGLQALAPQPGDDPLGRDAPGQEALFAPAALPPVSAVVVRVAPGEPVDAVRAALASFRDVSVYTNDEQHDLLLQGVVDKSRRQLGLFRAILVVVSAILVTLIVFTMTAGKAREIALLKLLGARTRVVLSLILTQSLALGALGYGFACALSVVAFPHFPRRVSATVVEYAGVAAIVLAVSLLASLAGIAKALRVPAQSILAS
jgi:putative ABC transport system permease protein